MNYRKMNFLLLAAIFLSMPVNAMKDKDKHKSLPPGLAKKVEQGKPLPPGWQKKLSKGDVLRKDLYLRGEVVVPLGRDGTLSVRIDGTVIKLIEKTREIIEILD